MTRKTPHNDTFSINGIRFFSGSINDVGMMVHMWIRTSQKAYVCVTGLHGITEAANDTALFRAHSRATVVVPDGMPVVWMGRAMGYRNTERIYGPDLMLSLCQLAEKKGFRIALYGSRADVLGRLSRELRAGMPKLKIVAAIDPGRFSSVDDVRGAATRELNAADADIIFVGLGTPKQELWMQHLRGDLRAPVLVGVGAAFDFLAKAKPQAPVFIRNVGLEWVFRIGTEPRRLTVRYIRVGMRFILLIFRQACRSIVHHS